MFFTGVRYRPRSGHRADEDTRITSYCERGTTTAARYGTAGLPSSLVPHVTVTYGAWRV